MASSVSLITKSITTSGYNSHFQNVYDTFVQDNIECNAHKIHYDESLYLYGVHIDKVLLGYCLNFQIDTVFLTFSGRSPANPSVEILKKLKEKGIFICVFWPDNNPLDLELRKDIYNFIDLNVPHDNPKSNTHQVRFDDTKHLYLWTPINKYLYYSDDKTKDVGFIGSSRYPERQIYLEKLKEKLPNICIGGGQRETSNSIEKYAELVRSCKIGINFCKNPMGAGYEQTKGRVFEVISSNSLLLEEKNSSITDFFTPNIDYVEFENFPDLLNKIDYYISNPQERIKIAENGLRKFTENYTSKHFWSKLISKIYEIRG